MNSPASIGLAPALLRPRDLFDLRFLHEARLSPTGEMLALIVSQTPDDEGQERFCLLVQAFPDGEVREISCPVQPSSARWSPDGSQLAFIGDGAEVWLAETASRGVRRASPPGVRVQGPLSWSPDSSRLAVTVVGSTSQSDPDFDRFRTPTFRSEGVGDVEGLVSSVHLLNIATGTLEPVDTALRVTLRPVFSPCGLRLAFLGSETPAPYSEAVRRGLNLFVLNLETGQRRAVLDERWVLAEAAWSPCGTRLLFSGACDSPLTVPTLDLWTVGIDGGQPQCRTAGHIGNVGLRMHHDMPTWGVGPNNVFVALNPGTAYVTVTVRGRAEIWRVALEGPLRCDPVVAGDRSCLVMGADEGTQSLLYCACDLRRPWELFACGLDGTREVRLTDLNGDRIARWPELDVHSLHFESEDGTAIEGWFIEPKSGSSTPRPSVMFIHGGPYLSTGHIFRYDFRLLASHGFGVFFGNFRGSSGYGDAFARAMMGDWGRNGFPDHMGLADAAVAAGLADPDRLGVWGHSHGGFATCWIVGHTGRFRAAVAEGGFSSFESMYYLSDAPHLFAAEMGGRPSEYPERYRDRSPLTYAGNCTTPTLLLHGDSDLRCPISEAEQFFRALHDARCETELVRVPGMNHMGDSTGPLPARRGQNSALLEWFERRL